MKRLIALAAVWLMIALPAMAETVSRITYLYVPACESCARAVKVLDSLAEEDSTIVIEQL